MAGLGASVARNPLIVEAIVRHLDFRDLKTVEGSVCEEWDQAVKRVLRVRQRPRLFCFLQRPPSSPSTRLDFFENESVVDPMLTLIMTTPQFITKHHKRKHEIMERLNNLMDFSDTLYAMISSSKIYYVPSHLAKIFNRSVGLAGVCMPKIDGVVCEIIEAPTNLGNDNCFNFTRSFQEKMSVNVVKCILVFSSRDYVGAHKTIIMGALESVKNSEKSNSFAVGGCEINNIYNKYQFNEGEAFNHTCKGDAKLNFITFSVLQEKKDTAKFDCSSIVLDDYDNLDTEIEGKIEWMSEKIERRQFSFAFKFSCYARRNAHNLEEKTFAKYFPKTPLIGCQAMGEIGLDFCAEDYYEPVHKTIKMSHPELFAEDDEYFHSYSTVFVIFMWGDKITEC